MKIRKITSYSDGLFNSVAVLLPQLGTEIVIPGKEYFKEILGSTGTHFFVLEIENKEIAGILTLCICKVPTGIKAWIEDVVVNKTHRGKGYGKALMLYALEFGRSQGARAVELTSRPSRIEANHLYQKLGFVVRETNLYKYIFR
jgi:ribosomal protein S18 acetylase RimI-like enzyme